MIKTAPYICSFPPVSRSDARVLILGSMPGEASLAAGQYYAHPRNSFWRIMEVLVGAGQELPYPERLKIMQKRGIALWDVLAACRRAGSLDSAISAEEAQDFPAFFAAHPAIRTVFFNGGKAEAAFQKMLAKQPLNHDLSLIRLPSTSPAHAARGFNEKCAAWREILDHLGA